MTENLLNEKVISPCIRMTIANSESSVIDLEESTVEEVMVTNNHFVLQPPLSSITQVMKIFNGNHHFYQETQQKQQVQ